MEESTQEKMELAKLKDQILDNFEKSMKELKEKSKNKLQVEKSKLQEKINQIEIISLECQDIKNMYTLATTENSD